MAAGKNWCGAGFSERDKSDHRSATLLERLPGSWLARLFYTMVDTFILTHRPTTTDFLKVKPLISFNPKQTDQPSTKALF
jgi:hypothetical protein